MWNERLFVVASILLLALDINCYPQTGPAVKATKGAIWPKPQQRQINADFFVLSPSFQFMVQGEKCAILVEALKRYENIVQNTPGYRPGSERIYTAYLSQIYNRLDKNIDTVDVILRNKCTDDEIPGIDMNESYTVHIDSNGDAKIEADTIWGMLRGMETFSQMIYATSDGNNLIINVSTVKDYPRFSHRGLLIDTSRHFLPIYTILRTIDAMEYNKMNVLHWHMTDDQSFPYESVYFPDLSAKGAFHRTLVYSQKDVYSIIDYARLRGIRVMVEFDTPGHTRSWGEALPKLLTTCYSENQPDGNLGPIDPTRNATYEFLKKFFKEIINVFPDQYIHLGGDEVDFSCWQSNPFILKFMRENGIKSFEKLEEYYVQNLVDLVDDLKASSIVWEEVFSNGVVLPKETVVHVWIDGGNRKLLMSKITQAGYRLLLSAGWYLDHIDGGGDWEKYYENDATDFPGTELQKQLVIGGEACMWGEVVDGANVLPRVWPRASAVAERLWSSVQVTDLNDARRRLEEQYCRMQKRGIPAQPPNGPGFCV